MLAGWCGIRGLCLACGEDYGDVDTCEYLTEEWYTMQDVVVLLSRRTGLTWLCRRISMFWLSLRIGMHCAVLCKLLLHRTGTPPSLSHPSSW
jgi:hypothetical protein